jgi:hypothetical protein
MATTFQSALRTYLLADSGITDIVGADGVYSFPAPQKADLPYILISEITEGVFNNLSARAGFAREEWQLDCMSYGNSEATALKDAVIDRVNNASPLTMSGFDVSLMIVDNVTDLSELEDDGSQKTARRKTVQVIVKRAPTT